jgi:hypothetical protein
MNNTVVLLNADGSKMLSGYDAINALLYLESLTFTDDEVFGSDDDEEDAA